MASESEGDRVEDCGSNTSHNCNWYEGLKEVFDVVQIVDARNVKVACKKCLPAKVILSSSKTSAANLLKHIQVC